MAAMKIMVVGLGPIGRAVAREIADADDLVLAAAVDPAPELAGRDLGELIGRKSAKGISVARDPRGVSRRGAKAAVHAASSRFPGAVPLLRDLVGAGFDVVSTCEELIAARVRWPAKARSLDRECRRLDRRILLGGINPGYLMDVLPVSLASACTEVRSIRIERHVDTAKRRSALQRKTGAGLPVAEFRRRARNGAIGHVGLLDSAWYVLDRLGLVADDVRETIRPIVAKSAIRRSGLVVPAGSTAGVHQVVRARDARGKTVALLDLKMAAGLADPHDAVRIAI
ncbi:dihydrodipicolinate reductase, partial [bacterium]|nr:dihydrodipicolinate reductase [bacterium]